ncbi:MAG: hypothetical protein JRJ48_05395 [Deltaproteobacteria bacterium]|nr:hypothetical protein [Deltaproteobacteria bacterium]
MNTVEKTIQDFGFVEAAADVVFFSLREPAVETSAGNMLYPSALILL